MTIETTDEWELPPGHLDRADVAADVRARIAATHIRIVSIDGWSGSGKTTLAKYLASRLKLKRYELDKYVHRERGGFLQYFDYSRLATALDSVPTRSAPVLIDGVCVLEVLRRLGLRPDLKV